MQNFNLNLQDRVMSDQTSDVVRSFVLKVYGWMCFALLLTGATALWAANSESFKGMLMESPGAMWILIIAEFGLVIWLSAGIKKMQSGTATLLFLAYSILNGLTLSTIFWAYGLGTVFNAFFSSALMFGTMSAYGVLTKKDLTSWGSFFNMGLIGIIIASVLNIFFASSALYWVISYLGVGVFLGLTAYDTQQIKQMAMQVSRGSEDEAKGAILGALKLYLDFINLFLMLLRIIGRRN